MNYRSVLRALIHRKKRCFSQILTFDEVANGPHPLRMMDNTDHQEISETDERTDDQVGIQKFGSGQIQWMQLRTLG